MSGSRLLISWPLTSVSAGLVLRQSSNLTAVNWADVPVNVGDVSFDGVNEMVTITPTTGRTFYRLEPR
jgi:hypothetical protein